MCNPIQRESYSISSPSDGRLGQGPNLAKPVAIRGLACQGPPHCEFFQGVKLVLTIEKKETTSLRQSLFSV